MDALKGKWNAAKSEYFSELSGLLSTLDNWDATEIESSFKALATAKNIKAGELLFPFRMMLVGGKFGPPVFEIATLLGKDETKERIEQMQSLMNK
jgi:glutamyl-tRNA synthetase